MESRTKGYLERYFWFLPGENFQLVLKTKKGTKSNREIHQKLLKLPINLTRTIFHCSNARQKRIQTPLFNAITLEPWSSQKQNLWCLLPNRKLINYWLQLMVLLRYLWCLRNEILNIDRAKERSSGKQLEIGGRKKKLQMAKFWAKS